MKYKVWWMEGDRVKNFGDVLTPIILKHYNIDFVYSKDSYNTISIGSIADKAKENCLVLGSGVAWENTKLNPKSKWVFVRGPLTRNCVIKSGGVCPEIYGDPALLLPNIIKTVNKKHDLGIIPHMKEYNLIKKLYPKHNVINLNNPNPIEVAQKIAECRQTISSSLHGIICSHAFGIPCAWVKFSNLIIGDDTKFKDHFLSLGLEYYLSSIDYPRFITPGIINTSKIEEIFKSLK